MQCCSPHDCTQTAANHGGMICSQETGNDAFPLREGELASCMISSVMDWRIQCLFHWWCCKGRRKGVDYDPIVFALRAMLRAMSGRQSWSEDDQLAVLSILRSVQEDNGEDLTSYIFLLCPLSNNPMMKKDDREILTQTLLMSLISLM